MRGVCLSAAMKKLRLASGGAGRAVPGRDWGGKEEEEVCETKWARVPARVVPFENTPGCQPHLPPAAISHTVGAPRQLVGGEAVSF